jgi:hypothetical protein
MDGEDVVDRQARLHAQRVEGPGHRLDVVEHLVGRHITAGAGQLSLHEATSADLEPLDLG